MNCNVNDFGVTVNFFIFLLLLSGSAFASQFGDSFCCSCCIFCFAWLEIWVLNTAVECPDFDKIFSMETSGIFLRKFNGDAWHFFEKI
jgi:hypothetical protein